MEKFEKKLVVSRGYKGCRLSLLTNSAPVIRVQMLVEGGGDLRGLSQ
jgi:hypothetical protein